MQWRCEWEKIKDKKVRSVMIINTESVSISPWPLIFQLGFFFFRSFYPSIQLIPSGPWLSSHRKGSSDPPVLFLFLFQSPHFHPSQIPYLQQQELIHMGNTQLQKLHITISHVRKYLQSSNLYLTSSVAIVCWGEWDYHHLAEWRNCVAMTMRGSHSSGGGRTMEYSNTH